MLAKFEKVLIICRSFIFLASLLAFYVVNTLFVFYSLDLLHDFGSFIAAGQLSKSGENPYSEESPLIFSVYFPGINHSGVAPNLNPPISVLVFETLAEISPQISVNTWRVVTSFLFIIAVLIIQFQSPVDENPPKTWRIFWVFGMAGIWHTIQLGQIYVLMFILAVATWVWFKEKKEILGGLALGLLIAIKPNFIFWAITLVVTRNYLAFWTAGVTATIVSCVPIVLQGVDIYFQWLEASAKYTPDLLIFPANNSIQGLFARFNLQYVGVVVSVIVAIFVLIRIKNQSSTFETVNALGILTSLLISPLAWTGYTLLTIPIMFEKKEWDWKYWSAAFIFMTPFYFPLVLFQASFFNFVFFGWFYGWGLLFILFSLLFDKIKESNRL